MKRWLEEIEARGWNDVDKVVCTRCVTDYALAERLRADDSSAVCDYCDSRPTLPDASAHVSGILDLIVDGFRTEYEDPVEQVPWSYADGGFQMALDDTYGLL